MLNRRVKPGDETNVAMYSLQFQHVGLNGTYWRNSMRRFHLVYFHTEIMAHMIFLAWKDIIIVGSEKTDW